MASNLKGILDLPEELLCQILGSSADVSSLHAVSITCKQLHQLFKKNQNENKICRQVAQNMFRPQYLYEALAEYESSRIMSGDWTQPETKRFFAKYTSGESEFFNPLMWNTQLLSHLETIQKCVKHLTQVFAHEAILGKNLESSVHVPAAVEDSEQMRFERAFYRFQIWCNIFGKGKKQPFDFRQQGSEIFARFAPWEVEQLASVFDFLMNKVVAVSDRLATTLKPSKGYREVGDVCNGLDIYMAQSHLSRGLPELDEILRETNELETLMTENRMSQARSEVDPISRAFSYYDMAYEPLLKDMSDEDENSIITPPVFQDDPGPEQVWRWAHQMYPPRLFVHAAAQAPLRRWAYVMWNMDRLETWNAFRDPWQPDDLYPSERFYREPHVQEMMEKKDSEDLRYAHNEL